MVVKLEDFLRRRSAIGQVVRQEVLLNSAGLREICQILFGVKAGSKLKEYFVSVENG